MEQYNTILIFGYGQTQLITESENKVVDSEYLQSLNAVIEDIYSKKPIDNYANNSFTRIAIYNNYFADWVNNNPNDYFKVAYDELSNSLIESLIIEIKNV